MGFFILILVAKYSYINNYHDNFNRINDLKNEVKGQTLKKLRQIKMNKMN